MYIDKPNIMSADSPTIMSAYEPNIMSADSTQMCVENKYVDTSRQ